MDAATLVAPADWRRVEFISDLHLSPAQPATLLAWQHYLRSTRAEAVFILGDLFEVWVGDDSADASSDGGFEAECTRALREAAQGRAVFVMHGNRDFLIGAHWCDACGVRLLPDPTALDAFGHRWLLSHGDALCLEDREYQAFRTQVRSAAWQHEFLSRPLAQRRAIARGLRDASEERKRSESLWADVDTQAARNWLAAAHSRTLIHGHTHRPAEHSLGDGLRRVVLSDWALDDAPPRAEVMVLNAQGLHREPLR
ncbi:MAG: UDP-2,3-diacylglucosamine diphosphatase [Burkholderiaceae bacterium]